MDILSITVLISGERLFQAYAALTWNVRKPELDLNFGTINVFELWFLVTYAWLLCTKSNWEDKYGGLKGA